MSDPTEPLCSFVPPGGDRTCQLEADTWAHVTICLTATLCVPLCDGHAAEIAHLPGVEVEAKPDA